MPERITDDIRILVALMHGYDVRDFYKRGYKWRAPSYFRTIEDPSAPDERFRCVSDAAIYRSKAAALIELDQDRSNVDPFGHDIRYRLTPTGWEAAATIDISLERVMQKPKPRAPKPPATAEEKQATKLRRYARSTLKFLAAGGRLVDSPSGWICLSMGKPYVPPGRNSYYIRQDRNLPLIRHLLDAFVGVDGLPSLRITPAGKEVIEKRRPL